MKKRASGFTLVEILVVLAIIAILSALLFPVFGRVREGGRQTTCQSNLQQVYFAVKMYRGEEGRYPDSLLDLMGEGFKYDNGGTERTIGLDASSNPIADKGTGYFKGGQNSLICRNDVSLALPHSSYGALTKLSGTTPDPIAPPLDPGRYVWNYWGYRNDGFAYSQATAPASTDNNLLVTPTATFESNTNPIKYSMSNRFAPTSTIITHCVFHRVATANRIPSPGELYSPAAGVDAANGRDMVLKLDGTIKAADVSTWQAQNLWQNQTP